MKVAMVTPYWFPIRGGVTTYVAQLSEELRRQGAEVHVLAREGGSPGAEIVGGNARTFASRIGDRLSAIRPDAVHAHGHWYALQCGVRYRRQKPGTRVVFTFHTEFGQGNAIRRAALSRLLTQADVVTTSSRDLLSRTLEGFRVRTRTEIVPPGTATRRASEEQVHAFIADRDLGARRPLVTWLGPLAYAQKVDGLRRLIEAMAVVRREIPKATLVVAGEGRLRSHVEELAQGLLGEGARFLGEVEDASPVLTATDVHAHISLQEGFGLAVLEAMACGAPVVANPVGGVPEIIRDGENGLLVEPRPDAIAAAIATLIQKPETASRLSARAMLDVAEKWRWDTPARRFLRLYAE